jgi:hypothetical protein
MAVTWALKLRYIVKKESEYHALNSGVCMWHFHIAELKAVLFSFGTQMHPGTL